MYKQSGRYGVFWIYEEFLKSVIPCKIFYELCVTVAINKIIYYWTDFSVKTET